MRFEVIAAFVIGVLLPVLEAARRGNTHWAVDFTTMFEDYLGGAVLLIGAWAGLSGEVVGRDVSVTSVGLDSGLMTAVSSPTGRYD